MICISKKGEKLSRQSKYFSILQILKSSRIPNIVFNDRNLIIIQVTYLSTDYYVLKFIIIIDNCNISIYIIITCHKYHYYIFRYELSNSQSNPFDRPRSSRTQRSKRSRQKLDEGETRRLSKSTPTKII